ncbi:hypothetical protein QUC31_004233, partial [Theobroma cacao]
IHNLIHFTHLFIGQPSVTSCSASKVYVDLDISIVARLKAIYKLIIIVEDNTAKETFVVFGDDGEKVIVHQFLTCITKPP